MDLTSFGNVGGYLGADVLSPMYQQLTGNKDNPFALVNAESGAIEYGGVNQARAFNGFDTSVFDPYQFTWDPGKDNSGTVTAFKDGDQVGSWYQRPEKSFASHLGTLAMLAGGAFGGLGLLGAGPLGGSLGSLFGGGAGAGAAGAGAGAAAGASPYALSGASFGTGGAIGASGLPSFAAGSGGLVGTGAGLGIGSAGTALGASGIGAGIGSSLAGLGESALPSALAGGGTGGITGPGLAIPGSTPPSAGGYGLSGGQFGNSGMTGGLVGTGNGLGIGAPGLATSTMGTSAGGGIGEFLKGVLGKGTTGRSLLGLVPSLVQLYQGNKQQNMAQDLMRNITGLTKPNSAYEQQLRQELERRDAAAGRRSQYGPRAVELQAKLAQLAMGQTGSLASLMGSNNTAEMLKLQALLMGGNKLLDIFGG